MRTLGRVGGVALVLLALLAPEAIAAAPKSGAGNVRRPPTIRRSAAATDNSGRVDANNLDMFLTNHGSFGWDLSTSEPGLRYPKGTTKTALFAGGTKPLGLEIQQSTFAFARGGALGNIIFIKFRMINKGANNLDSTYVSIWADPDLGDASDDLVGCDTTLSLGYCYNETNNDAVYGGACPAVGFDFFRGPIVQVSPGVYDTLGMTSFNKYINGEDP